MRKRIPIVGDWIKLKSWTNFYHVVEVKSETVYLQMLLKVPEDYSINCDWEFKTTPLPLYSEEQAASFLREKGYKVEEPPKPLSGEVVIYSINGERSNVTYTKDKTSYDKQSSTYKKARTIVAIVDWVEGEGL